MPSASACGAIAVASIIALRNEYESARTTLEQARERIDASRAVMVVTLPKDGQCMGVINVYADTFADLAVMGAIADHMVQKKLDE